MIFTSAKALVRRFFYLEFLPARLSPQLIRSGNHLVLLGEATEEESLMNEIGIPGFRVQSVENDQLVYKRQLARYQRGELKVGLYYGDLVDFVTFHLQSNGRFLVLNLDIYGLYRTHIDPIMTEILLFTRRNPRTVVATYSNVGRDPQQLIEGMKSLVLFRSLAPQATLVAVDQLYGRYRSAGLSTDASFNMVLRHLFWVRSHMEHIVLGRVAMGYAPAKQVAARLTAEHKLWERVWANLSAPFSYNDLLHATDNLPVPKHNMADKLWDVSIDDVTLATYKADRGWRHTGWFTTYSHVPNMTQVEWLKGALTALVAQPLRYATETSLELELHDQSEVVPGDLTVWTGSIRSMKCRRLAMPEPNQGLAVMDQDYPVVQSNEDGTSEQVVDLKPLITQLALDGHNTVQVRERIRDIPGSEDITDRSLTALIASARARAKKQTAS